MLQSSRRVLMIMGLINYPELGEVADKIEEELEYFARCVLVASAITTVMLVRMYQSACIIIHVCYRTARL